MNDEERWLSAMLLAVMIYRELKSPESPKCDLSKEVKQLRELVESLQKQITASSRGCQKSRRRKR